MLYRKVVLTSGSNECLITLLINQYSSWLDIVWHFYNETCKSRILQVNCSLGSEWWRRDYSLNPRGFQAYDCGWSHPFINDCLDNLILSNSPDFHQSQSEMDLTKFNNGSLKELLNCIILSWTFFFIKIPTVIF